jgi:hypothetical protein
MRTSGEQEYQHGSVNPQAARLDTKSEFQPDKEKAQASIIENRIIADPTRHPKQFAYIRPHSYV